jgi:hypothetical protein
MSTARVSIVFLAVLTVLGGLAWVSVKASRTALTADAHLALSDAAEKQASEVVAQLGRSAVELEERAVLVAGKPGIVELVKQTNSASDAEQVAATIADFYQDEPWFAKRVTGLGVGFVLGDRLLFRSAESLSDGLMAFLAQRHGARGSGLLASQTGLLLIGYARVPASTQQQEEALFVVARPFADTDLKQTAPLADALGLQSGPVTLSSGQLPERCCTARRTLDGATVSVSLDDAASMTQVEQSVARLRWQRLGMACLLALLVVGAFVLASRRRPPSASANVALAEAGGVSLSATLPSAAATRYQVVAPLGRGGMAQVSLARVHGAEGFKRTFVLKRLHAEFQANEEVVNQFINEARLGASLVHSNIVPIFDFGRDAEGFYQAQEYIAGRDVDVLIRASVNQYQRALSVPVVACIAGEVLKALAYAHQKVADDGSPLHIVHRDVSPNNVMVSAGGEVKLLDFGIVKSATNKGQTQAGGVKGNLFYMSPEQARGLVVDARGDLFSLAMVMSTALLGSPLYSGETVYELLQRAATGPVAADLEKLQAVAGPLWPVLETALRIDSAQRFAEAASMAESLRQAVAMPASNADLKELVTVLVGDALQAEQQRLVSQ